MHPEDTAHDTGYASHRTIVPMREGPLSLQQRSGVTIWTGDGFHVIHYPLRERSEMKIVAVFRVPVGLEPIDNEAYENYIGDTVATTQPEAATSSRRSTSSATGRLSTALSNAPLR